MEHSNAVFNRLQKLEEELAAVKGDVSEMRDVLMGDMKEPGGVLALVKMIAAKQDDMYRTMEQYKTDRIKLTTICSIAVAVGAVVGKFFFK